jgi:hypothetical protein
LIINSAKIIQTIFAQKLAKAFSRHWLSSNHGKEGIALAS